jgi:ATP-dependent DNA ligase
MQVRDPEEARRRSVRVFYHLFDLLYLDGYDLRDVEIASPAVPRHTHGQGCS